MAHHLLKAIEAEQLPPCQRFSCPEFDACANGPMACSAFAYYVQTGQSIHPHHNVFRRSVGGEKMEYIGEVTPTEEIFESVERDSFFRKDK